jgi:thiamine-phosphate pyrophosphorylase
VSRLNNSLHGPILCYVTDRRALPAIDSAQQKDALLSKIEAAAAAGVDWIQIREKDLSGRECNNVTREALQRVARCSSGKNISARVLVNDRLDVGISEHAGGVHLGEKSLPIAEARRIVGRSGDKMDFLIGVSCHSPEAAKAAADGGADYVFFGPVFATPSKASYGGPQGLVALAEVCSAAAIPVLAIGGITIATAAACFAAGAAGIAAIRLFQDAADLPPVIQSLRKGTK